MKPVEIASPTRNRVVRVEDGGPDAMMIETTVYHTTSTVYLTLGEVVRLSVAAHAWLDEHGVAVKMINDSPT